MVIVILQLVTLVHLKMVPMECPECSTTTPTTDCPGDTDTHTSGDRNTCDNTELIAQMNHLMNYTQNNTELLQQLIQIIYGSPQMLTDIISSLSQLETVNSGTRSIVNDILNTCDNTELIAQNNTEQLQQLIHIIYGSPQMLTDIISSLLLLETVNSGTRSIVNDILNVAEELLSIQNGSFIFSSHLPISCRDIKENHPTSPSGYYILNGKATYCHMEELCDTEGAWTRLGQFDMSDSTVSCPSGFKLYKAGGVRACGRPNGGASCLSIKLPSNGISYSQVCGKVVGYQYASADAVDTTFVTESIHNDINSYYVDGVSITQGFPRKHIWTLMAGLSDTHYTGFNCPCNNPPGATQQVQSFVGDDYFCESGNQNAHWAHTLYYNDPLWDGISCGTQEGKCCSAPGLPWFHKKLNVTSNDYIEVRVCSDQSPPDEDVPISYYDIYVK